MEVIFARLNKSANPVELVHRLCLDAHANPEQKKSRYIKRLTPVTSIRKTLSVDLAEFAKEILAPHFHSGGPPKTVCSFGVAISPIRHLSSNYGFVNSLSNDN